MSSISIILGTKEKLHLQTWMDRDQENIANNPKIIIMIVIVQGKKWVWIASYHIIQAISTTSSYIIVMKEEKKKLHSIDLSTGV